jgi:hypothetical protein
VTGALGGLAIWGFIEGRGEAALEAERERPVKAPLRVSFDGHGGPIVTLDAETRKQSGVEVITPQSTPYQDEIRAYGTVLDLDKLVTLDNNYVTAGAQLQNAQAKLVASQAAFERAEALYKYKATSLAQLQTAEASFRADQAGVATAEAQVRTLKVTALQEWGTVIGKSLVESGSLVARLIERMSAVPGTSIAESQRLGALVTKALTALPVVRSVAQRIGRAEKAEDTWGTHYSEFEVDLSPGASVWMPTWGGANSGKTSYFARTTERTP